MRRKDKEMETDNQTHGSNVKILFLFPPKLTLYNLVVMEKGGHMITEKVLIKTSERFSGFEQLGVWEGSSARGMPISSYLSSKVLAVNGFSCIWDHK